MPTIFDIAPPEQLIKEISIRGTPLRIRALTLRELTNLMRRFPQLAQPQTQQGAEWAQTAVDMMPAVIAAGLVDLPEINGEDPAEAVKVRLSEGEKRALFMAIMQMTEADQNEPRPFVAGDDAASSQPGKELDTNSSLPSSS